MNRTKLTHLILILTGAGVSLWLITGVGVDVAPSLKVIICGTITLYTVVFILCREAEFSLSEIIAALLAVAAIAVLGVVEIAGYTHMIPLALILSTLSILLGAYSPSPKENIYRLWS